MVVLVHFVLAGAARNRLVSENIFIEPLGSAHFVSLPLEFISRRAIMSGLRGRGRGGVLTINFFNGDALLGQENHERTEGTRFVSSPPRQALLGSDHDPPHEHIVRCKIINSKSHEERRNETQEPSTTFFLRGSKRAQPTSQTTIASSREKAKCASPNAIF